MEKNWSPSLPKIIKRKLKKLKLGLKDTFLAVFKPDPLRPPQSLLRVSGSLYGELGQRFKDLFLQYANLHPDHKVLDIGCGTGRMAVPLTGYLSDAGEYWGLDIHRETIQWCQEHFTPRHPLFHFIHGDLYSKKYNPAGRVPANEYIFPFQDGYFDLVFLVSVFSHLLPADVEHYLVEISRVLKPGGCCVATFFLYDQESEEHLHLGPNLLDFRYKGDNYLTSVPEVPEAAIAYPKKYIEGLFAGNNLPINRILHNEPIPGGLTFLTRQDIVVATRKN